MKNSADQGGRYPQRPKAEVDNTLRDLQNFSYPAKAELNNCFIIHSKYFPVLKGVSQFRSLFFRSLKAIPSRPQVFSVNGSMIWSGLHFESHFDFIGSIICSGLHFWRHWFNMRKILLKFGQQQLVLVNYACGFNQSETGKYFEWIISMGYWPSVRSRYLDIGQVLFCVFMDRDWDEVHKLAKKEHSQYPEILTEQTWSTKDLLYGFWWNFACRIQRVVSSRQGGSILPAWVANHSVQFSSCPRSQPCNNNNYWTRLSNSNVVIC